MRIVPKTKVRPKLPKSIDEVFIRLITYEVTTASNGNHFLCYIDSTKHIVNFTCQANIEVLRKLFTSTAHLNSVQRILNKFSQFMFY